ncbi:MAG: hypothetical protein ACI965_000102 [Paraglaciecola sp.]|jgi:hypothetical protein
MKIFLGVLIIALAGGFFWSVNQSDDLSEAFESNPLPVISRYDILHATDLVAGVKLAVAQNDADAIDYWLEKAIDVGEAANLSKEDIDYLRSHPAKKYVIFQAKRHLFNDAVEQAYYGLRDIDSIKAQYPQALSLFADADKLIADRNKLIQHIATELANGEQVNDNTLVEAQLHWQQRFAANTTTNTSSG